MQLLISHGRGRGQRPSAKANAKPKVQAKAKLKSQVSASIARAEVVSADIFAIVLEGPHGHPIAWQDKLLGVKDLESAARLADVTLEDSLLEANRCELHAKSYMAFHNALVAAGHTHGTSRLCWLPLPDWVVHALPAFEGQTRITRHPYPAWLPNGLMPYQQTAVHKATKLGGRLLLADEMGLGKTAQALAMITQYMEDSGPALIVTPSSLGGVWKSQIKQWMPQLKEHEVQLMTDVEDRMAPYVQMVIISYSLLTRQKGFSKTYKSEKWKIVVCDEAHCLRTPTSQRTKALIPILHAARHVILVTGTPTPKHASEAYSLIHALYPLRCSYKDWCNRYCRSNQHREEEVAAMLSEVMIRRLKSDVMEQLPPRGRQRVEVQLTKSATAAVRKLQNYGIDDEYFQELAMLKETAVQDYIEYLLEASSNKFLLFAHHRSMLDSIEKFLLKQDVSFIRIDGRTSMEERPGLVRRFQEEPACRVAVLAILAAGEGLSFTAASLCVFCELCPAVPGVIEQAEGRIHRIGQKASQVDAHYLVIQGTRDDTVFARLESRTGSVAQAVGDVPRVEIDVNPVKQYHQDNSESALKHKTFAMTDAAPIEDFRRSARPKKKIGSLLDEALADIPNKNVVAKHGEGEVVSAEVRQEYAKGARDIGNAVSPQRICTRTPYPQTENKQEQVLEQAASESDAILSPHASTKTFHAASQRGRERARRRIASSSSSDEDGIGSSIGRVEAIEVPAHITKAPRLVKTLEEEDGAFSAMLGSLIDTAQVRLQV
eukprot:CAMPEP_0169092864 /NCGR_PEP_ID=MMETSP1015-20121227/17131_1 /TAXON_ID=342587 /ORGANISM="Karlodinium micrum, Strain CCMP2283" /LENGTH=772 /DNA_ID=CAMNT_0009153467 /DNA_START=18 /DNA_END=2336 /DNA_ORIENTATION=-